MSNKCTLWVLTTSQTLNNVAALCTLQTHLENSKTLKYRNTNLELSGKRSIH